MKRFLLPVLGASALFLSGCSGEAQKFIYKVDGAKIAVNAKEILKTQGCNRDAIANVFGMVKHSSPEKVGGGEDHVTFNDTHTSISDDPIFASVTSSNGHEYVRVTPEESLVILSKTLTDTIKEQCVCHGSECSSK